MHPGDDPTLPPTPAEVDEPARSVPVWDLPTRLFHWLAALLVGAAWATWRLNWMDWHEDAGDALLALVLFRLLWGCFGSETARFAGFLAPPRQAVRHLAHILRREPDRRTGHNPAGGWMVILLLALLLGESLSGLYVANDVADEGPFSALAPPSFANAVTALHWLLWDALLAAIGLHLAAVLVHAVAKRQDLVRPMITGSKRLPRDVPPPRMAGAARALLLFGCGTVAAAIIAAFL